MPNKIEVNGDAIMEFIKSVILRINSKRLLTLIFTLSAELGLIAMVIKSVAFPNDLRMWVLIVGSVVILFMGGLAMRAFTAKPGTSSAWRDDGTDLPPPAAPEGDINFTPPEGD